MSDLMFKKAAISNALEESQSAKERMPTYSQRIDGVTEPPPGLWLVGDQGVYFMPNIQGKNRTIVYAQGCDPEKDPEWDDLKRATFGGDDGVEFIPAEDIIRMLKESGNGILVRFEGNQMTLMSCDSRPARSPRPR